MVTRQTRVRRVFYCLVAFYAAVRVLALVATYDPYVPAARALYTGNPPPDCVARPRNPQEAARLYALQYVVAPLVVNVQEACE